MGLRMRIAIASDHAAFDLKADLRDWLIELGHEVADLGPDTADSVDYPDFGYRLASVVADGTAERGVALCGSGIGIWMSVNRNPAMRCAVMLAEFLAQLDLDGHAAGVEIDDADLEPGIEALAGGNLFQRGADELGIG